MKSVLFCAFGALAAAEFSCIKPVNPIPAGPPGLCCQQLDEYPVLSFVYVGNNCKFPDEK